MAEKYEYAKRQSAEYLNQLRRDGIAVLKEAVLKEYRREVPAMGQLDPVFNKAHIGNENNKLTYLAVAVHDTVQFETVLSFQNADRIYVESTMFSEGLQDPLCKELVKKAHEKGKKLYYIMPAVVRKNTIARYLEQLHFLKEYNVDGVVVGNYEAFQIVVQWKQQHDWNGAVLTDSSLYTWSKEGKDAMSLVGAT